MAKGQTAEGVEQDAEMDAAMGDHAKVAEAAVSSRGGPNRAIE